MGGVCKEGYYDDSGNCDKCSKICKTCDSSDSCTECADDSRDLSKGCKCNVGFYSSVENESCNLSCSYRCEEC